MELSYWVSRWRKGKTGFHMPGGYPGLINCWEQLGLQPEPTVLVPLCGKTEDLIQLELFGATVIGVEISEEAILTFFEEKNRTFETESLANFTIRRSGHIELWEGDFFKFPENYHPNISLIYDKAALVALPLHMRKRYSKKIITLADKITSILLHHFIYPQEEMSGPPFSVSDIEIQQHFGAFFNIQTLIENKIDAEKFPPFQRRGLRSPLNERLLHLKPYY